MSTRARRAGGYDPRSFPAFAVTVDIVVLSVGETLDVLTVTRGEAPYKGRPALPGGFVREHESVDAAARRELREETGLGRRALPGVHLEQLHTFGAVRRDPRMRVVSTAYLALSPFQPEPTSGGDAAAADWRPAAEARRARLAFDHPDILDMAIARVGARLEYTTLATRLAGATFTLGQLQHVYECVWGVELERANFRRKVLGSDGFVVATGERRLGSSGGAPAAVYRAGPARTLSPPFVRA